MNIRPLGNQVAGLASYGADAQTQRTTAQQTADLRAANEDAASVQVKPLNDPISSDKASKLQKLKDQVQSGNYQPDTKEVAKSLLRDLL